MKKGIIAITLLLTGALLITPITNALSESDVIETPATPVKSEQTVNNEKVESVIETNNKTTQTNDIDNEKTSVKEDTTKEDINKVESNKNETAKEDTTKVESTTENKTEETEVPVKEDTGMSKSEAEAILNKYIKDVEQGDFTYTYQGDENTFEAIKEKGIKGYVFLPDVDTDMAYLVDKDNGSIYFFHPSGYFELLQQ